MKITMKTVWKQFDNDFDTSFALQLTFVDNILMNIADVFTQKNPNLFLTNPARTGVFEPKENWPIVQDSKMRRFLKEVIFSRSLADHILNWEAIHGSDLTFILCFGNVVLGKKFGFYENIF